MVLIDGNSVIINSFMSVIYELDKMDEINFDKDNFLSSFMDNKDLFKKAFLNTLEYKIKPNEMKAQFVHKYYGNSFVSIDTQNTWRKRIYPQYKATRKKSENKTENDRHINKIRHKYIEFAELYLKDNGYKIIKATLDNDIGVEGDDVIAVLAMEYPLDKHLIISGDKDFTQLLHNQNIDMWYLGDRSCEAGLIPRPNTMAMNFKLHTDIIKGQSKDNIKSIFYATELSPKFITHLKSLGIAIESNDEFVGKFSNEPYFMKIANDYIESINEINKSRIEAGAIKRMPNVSIYKNVQVKDVNETWNNIEKYSDRVKMNFDLNKRLVYFTLIPTDVRKAILSEFEKQTDTDRKGRK